jgi:uncharacterized protein (DUF1778 family)
MVGYEHGRPKPGRQELPRPRRFQTHRRNLVRVDSVNTRSHIAAMAAVQTIAEVNIHLRARAQDRDLIDQAAELAGVNRSQFMLASALREARNVLLDQTTLPVEAAAFQKVLEWMDSAPTHDEAAGMKKLLAARSDWVRD